MTEAAHAATIWLSKGAFAKLTADLEDKKGPQRAKIVAEISAARDEGDLKENGGYHAAKEEQGKIEARIRQLTALLRSASVGNPPDDGVVEPGMVVTAKIAGEKSEFLVGNREIAGDSDLDVYSEQSPLGVAIIGHREGETVTYTAPNGKEITVELLTVKTYSF
jgi:transcription elongation factor GreA